MDQNRAVVELFRNQIIECKWDESLTTLHRIELIDEKTAELASMAILKHKLSQLLKEDKSTEALDTLRNQIATVCNNDEALINEFFLSFVTQANNVVNGPHSYGEKALEDLRNILPREIIPEGRLVDHRAGRENIPSRSLQILNKAFLDEVWFLQFSHNGKYLASSSKDYRVVMWEVNEATYKVSIMRTLRGHREPVTHIPSGELLREYFIWGLGTVSCAWNPQEDRILFRNQIIEDKWDESLTTLHRIESIYEKNAELASMTILKHKLSQLFKEGKSTEALDTLRNQIAPVCKNDEVLVHEFCLSFVTLAMNIVNGPHSYGEKSLEDLKNILPAEMILEGRLVDHRVGRENIPSRSLQTLKTTCLDEVWFLQFSHNGKYLASSSKDYRVVMWEVNMATYEVSIMRTLRGHTEPVSYISWSSDGRQLLTCGAEESVRRWNIPFGENLQEYSIWGLGTVSCGGIFPSARISRNFQFYDPLIFKLCGLLESLPIDRKAELVRIMIDALNLLGYKRTGMFLDRESGIDLHTERVKLFVNQIIEGKLNKCLSTLHKIGIIEEKFAELASMTILQHKLSEFLYKEKFSEALDTLRNLIAPVCKNDEVLVHEYCVSFVTPSMNVVNGPHSYGEKALKDLRNILPPEGRLVDHRAGRDNIPSRTLQILKEHKDEVCSLQFSHSGKYRYDPVISWQVKPLEPIEHAKVSSLQFSPIGQYLAAGYSSGVVYVWEVVGQQGRCLLRHRYFAHEQPICCLSWSDDDNQLLTCGLDETVKRWSIHGCEHTYRRENVGAISCVWGLRRDLIFTGFSDDSIIMWDLPGAQLRRFMFMTMDDTISITADLAFTFSTNNRGNQLITILDYVKIVVLDLNNHVARYIQEGDYIVSISVSVFGDFLIAGLREEIHIWDLRPAEPLLVGTHVGHRCEVYAIRACFGGGYLQPYIASGSEDFKVYIWDRGSRLRRWALEWHSAIVGCVSWNPVHHRMLASGSDDGSVCIWWRS